MTIRADRAAQPWLNYTKNKIDVGGVDIAIEDLNEFHSNQAGALRNVDAHDDALTHRGQTVLPLDSPANDKLDESVPNWVRPYLSRLKK